MCTKVGKPVGFMFDTEYILIGIPMGSLKDLLLKRTFDARFLFDGVRYLQCDGVTMGSISSPSLADIIMAKLE